MPRRNGNTRPRKPTRKRLASGVFGRRKYALYKQIERLFRRVEGTL